MYPCTCRVKQFTYASDELMQSAGLYWEHIHTHIPVAGYTATCVVINADCSIRVY